MLPLSPETLEKIKKTKLAGSLGLTHKPVLPSIMPFSSRPKEFLDELRKLRETMSFKVGPSKRRIAASESEEEADGTGDGDSSEVQTTKRTRKENQSSKKSVADAAKLASSNLTPTEQANVLAALAAVCGPKRRKKNGS
jgi:hypothetical protein